MLALGLKMRFRVFRNATNLMLPTTNQPHAQVEANHVPHGFGQPCCWRAGPLKNSGSHIDASHPRQPLVKGERLVRYEVNAVMDQPNGAWVQHKLLRRVAYSMILQVQLSYLVFIARRQKKILIITAIAISLSVAVLG